MKGIFLAKGNMQDFLVDLREGDCRQFHLELRTEIELFPTFLGQCEISALAALVAYSETGLDFPSRVLFILADDEDYKPPAGFCQTTITWTGWCGSDRLRTL